MDAFFWNGPYYSSPESTTAKDERLWSDFRKGCLEASSLIEVRKCSMSPLWVSAPCLTFNDRWIYSSRSSLSSAVHIFLEFYLGAALAPPTAVQASLEDSLTHLTLRAFDSTTYPNIDRTNSPLDLIHVATISRGQNKVPCLFIMNKDPTAYALVY